jgi:hypothetical protein
VHDVHALHIQIHGQFQQRREVHHHACHGGHWHELAYNIFCSCQQPTKLTPS